MARKQNKHQKTSHGQSKLKKQQSPHKSGGPRNTNVFIGLLSHATFPILFSICLALAVFFYQESLMTYALFAIVGTVFFAGLGIILYLREYWLNHYKKRYYIWAGFGFLFCILLAILIFLPNKLNKETELHGVLLPGDDPSPPSPPLCYAPFTHETLLFYLGDSLSWGEQSPMPILRIKEDVLLTVSKNKDRVKISAKIFSEDNLIIAKIIDNEFYINPNNYFRRERPDKHTLIVYDQKDRRVLYVRYLNRSAVKILGIFHYPGISAILIEEHMIEIQSSRLSNYCLQKTYPNVPIFQIGTSKKNN